MNSYIIRQPILNRHKKVTAYEVIYSEDTGLFHKDHDKDVRISQSILAFFQTADESDLFHGRDAFLTFTPNTFMSETPFLFDKGKLVIQVFGSTLLHPNARKRLLEYKAKGFSLVLLDFEFNRFYLDLLPLFNILKIDFEHLADDKIKMQIELAQRLGLKVCAFHVNSYELKEKALAYQCDYYQGNSIADMVQTNTPKMDCLQSNFFQLAAAISGPNPDFDEIASIINLDVTLTFSLIRIVNSSYFALPNRVKDIQQALAILGLDKLRHWIYLLSFAPDGGVSDELIRLSFLRATLCQSLSTSIVDLPISKSDAYLMGMFSILDALFQVPMYDAINGLPISEPVKQALIHHEGICGDLLNLCIVYEKGQWKESEKIMDRLNIDYTTMSTTYSESLQYVNKTWSKLA